MKTEKILNKEQLEAIHHEKGPLLIIAGAGTGKTTVVTERIKYLIFKKKVEPSQILALTFTEKAANEMEQRVDIEMPYGYTQMWISTFHSFCDRVLRQETIHIGLNPSYKLLTEAETILLIRKNLFKFNLNYFRPLGNPNKFLEAFVQHFSRLKDEDVSPEEYLTWAKKQQKNKNMNDDERKKYLELAFAFKSYEELKIKEGAMDFSDLIGNCLNLFRKRPNILKNYQEQFKHIMVDEFQDTNYAQNQLAIILAGKNRNITVVGDDDQSIYRFRGSSISNIIQFKKTFPKAKIVTLTKNYRSTEEILNKSYSLIQKNNPDRLEAKEKINKKLISARSIKGNEIKFIFQNRVEDEAESVAKEIKILYEKNKYQFKDFAILLRANDHGESFIKAFDRARIPYQFLGPGRLFHQEEIKDLIAYLKVLYSFEDSPSLYRVLTMPIFKLESIEIASLLNLAKRKNYTLFETLENVNETFIKGDAKEKIENIARMIKRHLKLISKETAGQIIYFFLQDSGIIKQIAEDKNSQDDKKVKNMAKFFDKLKTYETEHETSSVFDVVDWIDLSMQMGESPLAADINWSENNAVNILTVHSSKGLEFSVVFLVNLVAQRFPTRERREKIPIPQELIKEILPSGDYHLQEERRLFYVGMTRAKDILFMTASNYYGEGKKERKISPFVYESIGESQVKKQIENVKGASETQLSLLEWLPKKETKINKNNNEKTPVNYLSYSQIQTFDICPLHYKLKYILKVPTPQSSAQSLGTSIHSTLRDYYQIFLNGDTLSLNDAFSLLQKNWVNEGYDSKEHEKKSFEKAKQILKNYLKNNFNKNNLPLGLEIPFSFSIDNLKIGGRIDRIDKIDDKKIEILDYKTGQNMPDEKKLESDMQLTVYALATTEVHDKILNKKPEEVLLSLYYLETEKKFTTVRSKKQLEDAKKEILKKAKEIEESDFICSGNILCQTCEFKMLCSTKS